MCYANNTQKIIHSSNLTNTFYDLFKWNMLWRDKCRALCFVQNCSWIGNIYFYVLFGKTLFLGKFVRAKYVVPSNIKRLSNVVPTLQSTLMIKYQYFYSFSFFHINWKVSCWFCSCGSKLFSNPIFCVRDKYQGWDSPTFPTFVWFLLYSPMHCVCKSPILKWCHERLIIRE